MRFSDVIDLITIDGVTQNDLGDDIPLKVYRPIYANKKSIRQSEFYQAKQQGLRPQFMFVVRTVEYNDEESLRYKYNDDDAKEYSILRTYDKNGEFTELIAQEVLE